MDTLVEFCRTGVLGPLYKGLNALDAELLLGPPDDLKHLHGDENWQRYRYGSLSIMLTCRPDEQPDEAHLRIRSIAVSFKRMPLDLPRPIAEGLVHDWTTSRLDDLLEMLRVSGVEATLKHESSDHGAIHQEFWVGAHPTVITAFDGSVSVVESA